ncbi:MAG: lysophospholipase [Spirochaetales bacterium]|nr:lysophospholipase [Spirochaetales bacterium]
MGREEFHFTSEDGKEIHGIRWIPAGEVKAALLINHGMAEHISRYEDFALFLNEAGFAVWGEDHRGHGRTAGNEENLGYFAIEEGWELVLKDMGVLKKLISETYPGKPLFILGHSMGSFLTRDFLCDQGEGFAGAIISGTGFNPLPMTKILNTLARNEIRRKGDRHRSTFLDSLSFGAFNKAFRPNRTSFDWLSRDEEQVDRYIADPYCGFVCTSSFYEDLSRGLQRILDRDRLGGTPRDLPLLLYSGDRDPVGGKKGSGVKKTARLYRSLGMKQVTLEFNRDGRHESLNETNRSEVYRRFLAFMEDLITQS